MAKGKRLLAGLLAVALIFSLGFGAGHLFNQAAQEPEHFISLDGNDFAAHMYDGQLFVSTDAFRAQGYDLSGDGSTLQPVYQDNIKLVSRPRNAESTEACWVVSMGGEDSTVSYGDRAEDGSRKTVDSQYGALCWKNWNGTASDQERYRLRFDVSGYNYLTFRTLSVGDNLIRVYGDGQELWLNALDDGQQLGTVTTDISSIDTISFGGDALSKSAVKDGYVLILNPVLDTGVVDWERRQ